MHKCRFSVPVIGQLVVVLPFAAALLCIPTPGFATPILTADLATFAVLGAESVTNVPISAIVGNVGVSTGTSITGFGSPSVGVPRSDPQVTGGLVHEATPLANQAALDLDAAILDLNAFGIGTLVPGGDLDAFQLLQPGFVIAPGTYTVPAATTNLVGTLTLAGGLDPNPVWVFQFPGTLITTDLTSNVVVTGSFLNNAGVYWNVGTAATLDGPTFAGNVVARTLISSNGDLTMSCGRLLVSGTAVPAAVTLIDDNISIGCLGAGSGSGGFDQGGTVPSQVPEPASLTLLATGLVGAAMWKRRRMGSRRPEEPV